MNITEARRRALVATYGKDAVVKVLVRRPGLAPTSQHESSGLK